MANVLQILSKTKRQARNMKIRHFPENQSSESNSVKQTRKMKTRLFSSLAFFFPHLFALCVSSWVCVVFFGYANGCFFLWFCFALIIYQTTKRRDGIRLYILNKIIFDEPPTMDLSITCVCDFWSSITETGSCLVSVCRVVKHTTQHMRMMMNSHKKK